MNAAKNKTSAKRNTLKEDLRALRIASAPALRAWAEDQARRQAAKRNANN